MAALAPSTTTPALAELITSPALAQPAFLVGRWGENEASAGLENDFSVEYSAPGAQGAPTSGSRREEFGAG